MNTFILVCFLAAANAGYLAPSTKILQGPSSSATIVGPDGSAISAVQPGGAVVTQDLPQVVAHTAPVLAKAAYAPLVHAYTAPLAHTYAVPLTQNYAVPLAQTYAAPVLAHSLGGNVESTVVAGPSGTITRGYGHYVYPHQYYL